jgi:hypothetical protein
VRQTLSKLWTAWSRLWRRDPEPQDPYAGVRVPLKRGPQNCSAVALAEPDEPRFTFTAGRRISR